MADAHKLFHKRFAAVARAEDPVADHSMANGPRKELSESSGEDEEDDDDEEEEEDDDESIVDRGKVTNSDLGGLPFKRKGAILET